ncbi:N-6 DNA methylase [Empedobacter falsenii]
MSKISLSETVTENIFRDFYGSSTFIEKSAIPNELDFKSKNTTTNKGYPDFLLETDDYFIVVEAKAKDHLSAINEVKHYMLKNSITKDIIGIAISGQKLETLKVDYFLKISNENECKNILLKSKLLTLKNIQNIYWKNRYGDSITTENLIKTLNELNKTFNENNKVKDTERSLFFSGLMIALKDNNFRNTYKYIEAPTDFEISTIKITILEAYNLNEAILKAITNQLEHKVNNLSKSYSWKDRFSFIKNIDYSLLEYKKIINKIENNIFKPFQNDEKQDILGKAYKIFLKRAGKIDNKNIILTPDHIKSLMIELSRLNVNDVVLDTCTGTGGFLMEAMEVLIKLSNNDEEKINNIKENQLIGFEVDSVLFALACSNMFLHGDGRTNLLFRSSLLDDKTENIINNKDKNLLKYINSLKPTKCIINPPYESNSSIKFTIQALEYLEANGKLIIIMPTPTLTQNQNGLTEKLLEVAKLEFVIKMPYNLFSEQKRNVNTSIFGFTKTPHNQNDEVLFYNLEDDGFVSIQHKGRIDKFDKWNDIKNTIIDSILNSKEINDISQKRKIYKDGILNCAGIQNNTSDNSEMLKIEDLFNIEKGSLASDDSEDGDFDFITGADEWKKHSDYKYNKEALVYVVSAAGSLGKCHYVNGKFTASNLCLVLTPKNNDKYPINLQFYNAYFNNNRKKIVSDLADGTSKLTIGKPILQQYYIDYIPKEKQDFFVDTYIKEYKKNLDKLKELILDSENTISNSFKKLF